MYNHRTFKFGLCYYKHDRSFVLLFTCTSGLKRFVAIQILRPITPTSVTTIT